jgi:hypothetical protein
VDLCYEGNQAAPVYNQELNVGLDNSYERRLFMII